MVLLAGGPVDPPPTTGTISAHDTGTSSTTNSNGQTIVTGTASANSVVSCAVSANSDTAIELKATGSGTGTIAIERSVDNVNFFPLSAELLGVGTTATSYTITDTNALLLRANVGEMTFIRVRATGTFTMTSFAVTLQPGYGLSQFLSMLRADGPAGTPATAAAVSLLLGTQRFNSLTSPTNGQQVAWPCDANGIPYVNDAAQFAATTDQVGQAPMLYQVLDANNALVNMQSYEADQTTSTNPTIAATASKRVYILGVLIQAANGNTGTMTFQLQDATANTPLTINWEGNARESFFMSLRERAYSASAAGNGVKSVITGTGTLHVQIIYAVGA